MLFELKCKFLNLTIQCFFLFIIWCVVTIC